MDSFFSQSAVDFQLLFARPTHPDTHGLTRQVGPHPLEPRQRVFQLSQLDSQACFVGAGVGCEYVEDQFGAIDDLRAKRFFEIPGLGWGQVIIEEDHVGTDVLDKVHQFLDLAFT